MSAKYACNICGEELSRHYNKFKEHQFISNNIRVCFMVDFNQFVENDICIPCALQAINVATKKLMKETE